MVVPPRHLVPSCKSVFDVNVRWLVRPKGGLEAFFRGELRRWFLEEGTG